MDIINAECCANTDDSNSKLCLTDINQKGNHLVAPPNSNNTNNNKPSLHLSCATYQALIIGVVLVVTGLIMAIFGYYIPFRYHRKYYVQSLPPSSSSLPSPYLNNNGAKGKNQSSLYVLISGILVAKTTKPVPNFLIDSPLLASPSLSTDLNIGNATRQLLTTTTTTISTTTSSQTTYFHKHPKSHFIAQKDKFAAALTNLNNNLRKAAAASLPSSSLAKESAFGAVHWTELKLTILSYAGPCFMGIGCIVLVIVYVVTFESRDREAKLNKLIMCPTLSIGGGGGAGMMGTTEEGSPSLASCSSSPGLPRRKVDYNGNDTVFPHHSCSSSSSKQDVFGHVGGGAYYKRLKFRQQGKLETNSRSKGSIIIGATIKSLGRPGNLKRSVSLDEQDILGVNGTRLGYGSSFVIGMNPEGSHCSSAALDGNVSSVESSTTTSRAKSFKHMSKEMKTLPKHHLTLVVSNSGDTSDSPSSSAYEVTMPAAPYLPSKREPLQQGKPVVCHAKGGIWNTGKMHILNSRDSCFFFKSYQKEAYAVDNNLSSCPQNNRYGLNNGNNYKFTSKSSEEDNDNNDSIAESSLSNSSSFKNQHFGKKTRRHNDRDLPSTSYNYDMV